LRDQTGAVTIDWIGLASAIVLLGLVVVYSIYNNSAASLLVRIDDTLTDIKLAEPGTPKHFSDGTAVASAGSPVGSSPADPGASSSKGDEGAIDGTHDSTKNEGAKGDAAIGDVAKSNGTKSGDSNHDGAKDYGAKSDGAKSEGTKSEGTKSDWGSGGGSKGDGGKGGGGKSGRGGRGG
jgi:uncharacterized membrane protein YgcG